MGPLTPTEREAFVETLLEHIHHYLDHSPDRAIFIRKVVTLIWLLLEKQTKADLLLMFGRMDKRTGLPRPLKDCVQVKSYELSETVEW